MKMFGLKQIVRKVVYQLGYDVVRKSGRCTNDLDVLKLVISALIQSQNRFFFIQVGANDGVLDDPLHSTIMTCHLEGVLVEPLPDKFKELKHNYANEKQLQFENCAISHENGECALFRITSEASYPPLFQGIASFNREHLRKHGIREAHIEQVSVLSLTFASLIEKYQIKDLSLLQIDTEGFDYEIIKMAFASSCFPQIIHFEHLHLSPKDRSACWQTLTDRGYAFSEIGYNTLAIHNALL